ncbi:MAG: hypothetical protein A3E85_01785 [Gammaproteobacteria bacterium RIFCSPHIGHO2_12_FULL_45_12]|nr:MAG: hypothetical protein A3E85_01785 [Gammaproteobacteria bacterium RIFCSPHIGHO2_12_FULL_45_12]
MKKAILVHTEHDDVVHPVSPELFKTLAGLASDEEIEMHYASDTDYLKKSYRKRLHFINQVFKFICQAVLLPATPDKEMIVTLLADADKKLDRYTNALDEYENIKDFQRILEYYMVNLRFLLMQCSWNGSKVNREQAAKWLAKGDQYVSMLSPRYILATLKMLSYEKNGSTNSVYIVQMEVPLASFNAHQMAELWSVKSKRREDDGVPTWYKGMSPEESVIFQGMLSLFETPEALSAQLFTKPSMLKTIPGLENLSRHVLACVSVDGKKLLYQAPDRFRSSMIASRAIRDMKLDEKDKKDLRSTFTLDNIRRLLEVYIEAKGRDSFKADGNDYVDDILLFQTLVSPVIEPDTSIYDDKMAAIEQIRKQGITVSVFGDELPIPCFNNIIATNHPLNAARKLSATSGVAESGQDSMREAQKLFELARACALKDEILNAAVRELENLLNVPIIEANTQTSQRELHLAALEEIIVGRLKGMSYGSCVSGKDRKALELMYGDAMEIVGFLYDTLPQCGDDAPFSNHLRSVFSTLFLTRHQQLHAGQNAPGSNGIKTPSKYLPKTFRETIKKQSHHPDVLKESHQLACHNELDRMFEKIKQGEGDCVLFEVFKRSFDRLVMKMARDFVEGDESERVARCADALYKLIHHDRMNEQGSGLFDTKTPDKIGKIREFFRQNKVAMSILTPAEKIDAMAWLIFGKEQRLNEDGRRSKWTKEFYELVLDAAKEMKEKGCMTRKVEIRIESFTLELDSQHKFRIM